MFLRWVASLLLVFLRAQHLLVFILHINGCIGASYKMHRLASFA
jgi:hypothetical protein